MQYVSVDSSKTQILIEFWKCLYCYSNILYQDSLTAMVPYIFCATELLFACLPRLIPRQCLIVANDKLDSKVFWRSRTVSKFIQNEPIIIIIFM
jgi:hypothetical protein